MSLPLHNCKHTLLCICGSVYPPSCFFRFIYLSRLFGATIPLSQQGSHLIITLCTFLNAAIPPESFWGQYLQTQTLLFLINQNKTYFPILYGAPIVVPVRIYFARRIQAWSYLNIIIRRARVYETKQQQKGQKFLPHSFRIL